MSIFIHVTLTVLLKKSKKLYRTRKKRYMKKYNNFISQFKRKTSAVIMKRQITY